MRGAHREEFKTDGVDVVRDKLERGQYKETTKRDDAIVWLRQKDKALRRKQDAETIKIARSAMKAAWWAIGISILALGVSIFGLGSVSPH